MMTSRCFFSTQLLCTTVGQWSDARLSPVQPDLTPQSAGHSRGRRHAVLTKSYKLLDSQSAKIITQESNGVTTGRADSKAGHGHLRGDASKAWLVIEQAVQHAEASSRAG